jgi:hypothetical protein
MPLKTQQQDLVMAIFMAALETTSGLWIRIINVTYTLYGREAVNMDCCARCFGIGLLRSARTRQSCSLDGRRPTHLEARPYTHSRQLCEIARLALRRATGPLFCIFVYPSQTCRIANQPVRFITKLSVASAFQGHPQSFTNTTPRKRSSWQLAPPQHQHRRNRQWHRLPQ